MPVTGGTCTATIINPSMTTYGNYTLSEITTRAGMYYTDFIVPKTLGVYPYGVDCTQGGKNYYLADTFHVRDMSKEVWQIPPVRNLTYYADMTNYTKVAETTWQWQGGITSNILDIFSSALWQYMGARAEILT